MLMVSNVADERLTTTHRAKLAYIYVRQSSVHQVRQHQESTELQYRLVDRAVRLGWPHERVQVIDEDLGKSGAGGVERQGFQKLIAEIGLGNAGLVISLDASRLARNNRDWHQLLELCSVFGVLIADGERLYDPRAYHDRLLLGLSGIMSEAELHQIQIRLHQGERQKAARGELRLPLPAGLALDRAGSIVLNPDEEVQARLELVFTKFRELQSARAVMRFFRAAGLKLPVRPVLGPSPHEVAWREADSARVRSILQNPAYAGAYVYGRRQRDPSRCRPGSLRGTVKIPIADWAVCLQAAHPGYISWEEFMANQRRLADNTNRYEAGHTGAPRKGAALLQGIAFCGRCGRRMSLRYTGPNGDYPVYCCRADKSQRGGALCQEVRALAVDELVEGVLLESLAPDRIAIALAAVGELEEESRQLDRQWTLRRERARYEAERARRQYDAVEPENRLVARSLERAWEEKLRVVEVIEQEHARSRPEEPLAISDTDRAGLQALGENLPRIWHAPTTSAVERKRILRFIIREVVLDQKRSHAQNHLADRSDQRASSAAARSHLRRLHRHRPTATTDHGTQRRRQDGQGNSRDTEPGRLRCSPRLFLQGRERLVTAVPLARPDREDQWRRRQSDVLARRQLLGPGGGGGARHHATNRVRLSCARAVDWPPAGKGTALANQPV